MTNCSLFIHCYYVHALLCPMVQVGYTTRFRSLRYTQPIHSLVPRLVCGWSTHEACATKCKSLRRKAKRTYFVENVSAFLDCTEREDMVVYQDDHTLYLLAAALSHTHRSRRGLHSVVAAFTFSLLFHFCARLLALSHSNHNFWHFDVRQ